MNLNRLKDNLLHVHNLRKALGYSIFFDATKSETKHQIIEKLPRGNVLILSPHPDDETFGCGGTIKLHAKQKDKVKIVFFTNEKTSRETEARKAAEILGASDIEFLDNKDGQIGKSKKNIERIAKIIQEFKPEIINSPSILDPNPDHFAVAEILYQALKKISFSGEISLYEIWSTVFVNRLVPIDKTFQSKVEAMSIYESQLKDRDYLDAFVGLARYRAGMFNAGKYAEAFFSCKKELYLKLFDLIDFKK